MIAQANVKHLPLADNSVDLIFTDPPYPREYLPCYDWLAREAMRVLKPGGFVLAMGGGVYLNEIYRMLDDSGLLFIWQFALEKLSTVPGVVWTVAGPIATTQKPIFCYSKGDPVKRGYMMGSYRSMNKATKEYHHWGQDVASARYYIDCFSAPGDLVLDPFIGGGTTLIACELIGRRCAAFDLDPVALVTTRNRRAGTEIPRAVPLLNFA